MTNCDEKKKCYTPQRVLTSKVLPHGLWPPQSVVPRRIQLLKRPATEPTMANNSCKVSSCHCLTDSYPGPLSFLSLAISVFLVCIRDDPELIKSGSLWSGFVGLETFFLFVKGRGTVEWLDDIFWCFMTFHNIWTFGTSTVSWYSNWLMSDSYVWFPTVGEDLLMSSSHTLSSKNDYKLFELEIDIWWKCFKVQREWLST